MLEPLANHKAMTFEEAARLDPDEQSGELDGGRWIPVTKNTWRHGEIVANACRLLWAHAHAHPGWSVSVGDPGTKLQRNPDTLRGPDVGVVRAERRPEGKGAQGWLEGAPDLAVEVLGDAQSISEETRRALQYLAAGARMVWLLEPHVERVLVFTPPSDVRVLCASDTLDGVDVLPGFSCKVSELFA